MRADADLNFVNVTMVCKHDSLRRLVLIFERFSYGSMNNRHSQHAFSTFGSGGGSEAISIPRQSRARYVDSVQQQKHALTTRPHVAATLHHRGRQQGLGDPRLRAASRFQQNRIPMPNRHDARSSADDVNSTLEKRHCDGRNNSTDWIAQLAGDTKDDSSFEYGDEDEDDRCASAKEGDVVQVGKKQRDFFYWRTQQQKIDALLAESNLERVEMPSDGNCLFHAVASFFDSFTTPREVRHRICDYIDQNRERFEIDILHSGYASIDEYLRAMRRDREWGDAIMLNAFCLCFDINVVLFTPDGSSEMYPGPKRAKMALVAFGQHYTATRVRNGARNQIKVPVTIADGGCTDEPSVAQARHVNF